MEKTIWLHVKSGHFYAIHEIGLREYDLEPQFAYRRLGKDNKPEGVTFYRTVREFLDGRFTQFQVNGVGGEVVDGARPAKRGKADEFMAGIEIDNKVDAMFEELEKEAEAGRPCLDVDAAPLKVGDWVQPYNVRDKHASKLPKGSAPYQIKRIAEGDFPYISFSDEKDATRWYPAVFRKDTAPENEE